MIDDRMFFVIMIAMLKSISPIIYGQSELYKNDIYLYMCPSLKNISSIIRVRSRHINKNSLIHPLTIKIYYSLGIYRLRYS